MSTIEIEREPATKGVANGGLVTGIIGTAGFGVTAMTAILNALNKANNAQAASNGADVALAAMVPAIAAAAASGSRSTCSEDHTINRYEAGKDAEIAELRTEIKLRDANTYTDGKMLELYQYIDGRLRGVEGQISQQAVYNATNTAALNCMQGQIAQLMSLTKMVIPNSSVCPGWGAATVTVSTGTTTT